MLRTADAVHLFLGGENMDIAYELRKCKDSSCSRCVYNGTRGCYVEIAIKELGRYEQAMDAIKAHMNELKGEN